MKLKAVILAIALLAISAPALAQDMGKYNFFTDFEVATSYWCYESNCATTKNRPLDYVTSGQLFVGNYTSKAVFVKINQLASTSLTVRLECRADILSGSTPYWANIWTKTYTAATTGLSGSDPIGEVVNVPEYCAYIRVATISSGDQTGDKLTVHGSFKQR